MPAQMFIFVVTKEAERVREVIERLPADRYFMLKSDTWFVLFDGTPRKLAENLGIRDGTVGSGIVAPITSYSGRASGDLWDWLAVKWPNDD